MVRPTVVLGGGAIALLAIALTAWPQADEALARRGSQLFFDQGCYGCHTVGKVGTPIATDLSRIGARRPEADLAAWLRDPAREKPTAHMPKLELSEAEIQALAAYLAALR
jgi:cytochrome c oxidase subunit 2